LNNNQEQTLTEFPIDPLAEPTASGNSSISPLQEADFYKDTGLQYRLAHNGQNLGYLGKFFGANSSAPTNIAGFVILCSLFILFVSLFFPTNPEIVESRKWLIGLVTSAMSFVFGAATKK
jgi:hypothetical protein